MSVANGKDLNGTYVGNSFAEQYHADAKLSGKFIDVDFTKANLRRAELSGTFVNAVFNGADLTDADLRYGTFVESEFISALVTIEQITQAKMLSNVKGPACEQISSK